MNYLKTLLFIFLIVTSCKTKEKKEKEIDTVNSPEKEFVIAFGSCNNQNLPNNLWKEIKKNNPDVWIWGGDIIYTDTEDMEYMKQNYQKQKTNSDYNDFIKNIDVLATWDDHDYGVNDGGSEYSKKAEAQQLFLDFFDVPATDKRRKQEGVYYAKDYIIGNETIKVIILDTRYFRTSLTPDTKTNKRFKPNNYGEGTMLGETQWNWLKDQLNNSKATYNIIVSSIQFLSCEHGFETWGNMPHEVDKLETILKETNAKNTIIISGDRHISEISKKEVEGLSYPLIDFTSSGLTHSYTSYNGEPNKYRVSSVVPKKSFGLLQFDFENKNVIMKIIGENNITYETYTQRYF